MDSREVTTNYLTRKQANSSKLIKLLLKSKHHAMVTLANLAKFSRRYDVRLQLITPELQSEVDIRKMNRDNALNDSSVTI